MPFTVVTVTGRYLDASGTPLAGTVRFTLSASMSDTTGHVIRAAEPVLATLDADGAFSVPLAANDDPATVPTGVTYQVEERLTGKNGTVTNDYAVVVPHNAANHTVDLTQLAPVANSTITYGVTSVNGQTGAVIVSGGTGGDVADATDTTKGIVQLAGDLAGTADAPTVPALAAKQPVDADLTAIAALDSATAGAIASDGAGWVKKTYAQLKTALGLGNVDNTSDVDKPVSTATQAAFDAKQALDPDLTTIAALDATVAGALVTDGAGWIRKSYAQLKTVLGISTSDVSGLGTAATHAATDFDTAGAATSAVATHVAAADPHADRAYTDTKVAALVNSAPAILDTLGEIAAQLQSDESTAAALATTVAAKLAKSANLSDVANAGTARTNLGLGDVATRPASDFDAAGAAAAVKGLPLGLTGATQPTRYVGRWAATGAPASGTFAVGDFGFDGANSVQLCTAAGTPGTWVASSGPSSDLTDRTSTVTETVPAGFTTNATTAGVTLTAPALLNPVGTVPQRFAVRNASAGTVTVSYPVDPSGATTALTVLAGEVLTFRQKSLAGWAAESGNKPLSSLDNRYQVVQQVAPGLNLYNAKGLRRWHQKLGDALFTRAPIVVAGDSLVYGQGADGVNGTGTNATDAVQGWPGQLRTILSKTYGDPGEGFWFPDDSRITQTGTPIGVAQYGVMRHGRRLLSTQSLTFTIPAGITTVGIVQYNNSGDVSAVYTKNGGGSGNVTTLTGTGIPLETEIACAAGDVFVVTGPATAQTYIVGIIMRNGTTGVPVHRLGQPGYVIGDLLGGQTSGTATLSSGNQALAIGAAYRWSTTPGLLIVSYGINDQANAGNAGATGGVTAALYQTWLTQVCTQAVADGWAVLILGEPPAYNPSTAVAGSTEADYRAAQLAVALSMDHVAYLDTKDVLGTNAQANAAGLNFTSSVHLTRRGYGVVARTVARAVLEPVGENAPNV